VIRCRRCGIEESVCYREQQRHESSEPCDDRLAARYAELGITLCPDCETPTHATETDDTGRCASCRSCYYCDHEATRTGIERDRDGNARQHKVCEDCGESSDRAERLHRHLVREERI
jgi:hypothetical protein